VLHGRCGILVQRQHAAELLDRHQRGEEVVPLLERRASGREVADGALETVRRHLAHALGLELPVQRHLGFVFEDRLVVTFPIVDAGIGAILIQVTRDEVGGAPYALDADGCVRPSETPGLGVEINEKFINAHPLIEGPCYV